MNTIDLLTRLFKVRLDYREHRGLSEFRFRAGRRTHSSETWIVTGREPGFSHELTLRKRTSDWSTFDQVFLANDYNLRRYSWAAKIQNLYAGILAGGEVPLILDLGANIGLASLYFAKNWPQARITALEPEKRNFDLLSANTRGIPSIQPILAAIASRDGNASIANPNAEAWAFQTKLATNESPDTVKALSVPTLIARARESGPCVPFIAKIDIEGFEENLFSENTEWVEQFAVVIIELHDWLLPGKANSRNFLNVISRTDRDFIFHGENAFSISNSLI
jgi:FkbM family methyltransferase